MEVTAEQIRSTWAEALKQARHRTGKTQLQFALHLGWDPQRVSRMERGIGSMETFAIAAADLGVELIAEVGE